MSVDFDAAVLMPAFALFGIAAIFIPEGGSSEDVTLIRVNESAEAIEGFYGQTKIKYDSRIYDMRKNSATTPQQGDILELSGTQYIIDEVRLMDTQGLIWRIELAGA